MSKLKCSCGHILSNSDEDSMENLWGSLISNGAQLDMESLLATVFVDFCNAYKDGMHLEWLKNRGNVSVEQDLESTISDLISKTTLDIGSLYARCTKCGTVMIEDEKEPNTYVPYTPAR